MHHLERIILEKNPKNSNRKKMVINMNEIKFE